MLFVHRRNISPVGGRSRLNQTWVIAPVRTISGGVRELQLFGEFDLRELFAIFIILLFAPTMARGGWM